MTGLTLSPIGERLRAVLRADDTPATAAVLAGIEPHITDVSPDCRLFFELLVRRASSYTTTLQLARDMGVVPTTFMCRFFRAGLPSPKTYLVHMRLALAAFLLQSPGLSISAVSDRLGYSSPQSFGRHVMALLGVTAGEFRRRFPFPVVLERYSATFLAPYRDRLARFRPLGEEGS